MAQNLKINNKDYNGVSIIAAPNANGGTARFYDTSNASADASDIAAGKTAYVAGGKVTGTGGGGGGGTLGTKTITSNGTYDASDDGYDGYSQVTANVPASAVDSGTKSITTNGTHDVIGYASANVAVPASAVDTGTKSISTNGTHDVIGYANASVSVPASAVDSGTKSITSNGSGQDVIGYAAVDVNVPNSYSASDEGKVVSSGALVSQTAHADVTPTTSDQTISTTTNNSIKVKGDADLVAGNIKKDVEIFGVTGSYEGGGGGGGYTGDDLATRNYTGAVTIDTATSVGAYAFENSGITSVSSNSVTSLGNYAFSYCQSLTTADFPNLTGSLSSSTFQYCTALMTVNFPKANIMGGYNFRYCTNLQQVMLPGLVTSGNSATGSDAFRGCSALKIVDLGKCVRIDPNCFNGDSVFDTLILRRTSICALNNVSAFTGTPFESGGSGGTIYIPESLFNALGTGTNDYEAASNWSTIYGYGTITWKKIEGSIYE